MLMIKKTVFLFLAVCLAITVIPGKLRADWREETGRLRIGLLDTGPGGPGGDAVTRYEPFRLAVEEKLGLSVELTAFSSLVRLTRAHAGGRLEYAIYPATSYAAVWINCECVEPLAVAAAGDGTIAAHSVLITRRGNGVSGPGALSGRQVWLLAEEGMLTRHFAVHAMKTDFPAFDEKSVEWLKAENPRVAIERFLAGEGDAMIGWSSLAGDAAQGYARGTPRLIAEQAGDFSRFRIVWQSPALAHHVHAIRRNVDGEAKRLLREMLTSMEVQDPVAYDTIEPVFEGGLQPVSHSAFQPAIAFVRSLLPEGENVSGRQEGGGGGSESEIAGPQVEDTTNSLDKAATGGLKPLSQ